MKTNTTLRLLSCVVLMSAACGAPEPAKTAPAAAPVAAPAAAAPAMAASAPEIGVPECDDYLTKYQACVESKVPEAGRASLRQSMDQVRTAWKQASATPVGKSGLAAACKQMTDTAKTSMAAYNCTF